MSSTEVSTYLGQKGYTIFKECLSIKEQQYIRDELTVKAKVPLSPVPQEPFPIYRESKLKLYVPRYFGIETYGEPDEIRIGNCTDINLKFKGELRDFQKPIAEKFMNSINVKTGCGGGLIDIPCGFGKTILGINLISKIKKKTLIIVHKSFLLNQWIERINEFLPDAKIGVIQGQIIDIENKDIVIGMLQSLSGKEYPQNMFESFGFTIIDETHHASSEIFSRALQKIVTPVMLGLSATMQRKDGLTRVFKMFLGDIVFKMKRENDDEVLVKAIEYQTDDKDFNEVQIDWKGQVAYSTMVSKICSFNHRTEFIIKVIKNELEENPNQQIMVLGSQKDILVYIYKAIEHRNIASVGYYVGGMKEKDLKLSETKKVVVATYAMAAEGLDIKTLTTLFLVTPRTDITQAVGRILRVKHERPLVVDIVDNHDVFKRQWMKRKAFYKKNKYKIISTNSNLYGSNTWTTLYDKNSKIDTIIKNKDEIPKGKCLIKF
jgi:superfamily II DNA or RNA helicase